MSEVLPEPPSPLGWDLVWEGSCVQGWRDLFVQGFGMDEDELDRRRAEAIGIFGGYAYLGAALFRVWAGRTPGMKPTTIDELYFGDHPDVPPYVAEAWHTNPRTTERMAAWLQWATLELDQSALEADREESLRVRLARPDFSGFSDDAVLGYLLSFRPLFRRMFHQHINQSAAASIGPGILGQICTALGHPEWAMRLISGLGGVDSANAVYAMWDLSRDVRRSAAVSALFDTGVDGLLERARASDEAEVAAFVDAFDVVLAAYGSRGPNEWELASPVWEVNPAGALAAIDRMRLAGDAASPTDENEARQAQRLALAAEVHDLLSSAPDTLAAFEVGRRSAATFIPGRERSKTTIIRVLHEARLAAIELGRRFSTLRTSAAARRRVHAVRRRARRPRGGQPARRHGAHAAARRVPWVARLARASVHHQRHAAAAFAMAGAG